MTSRLDRSWEGAVLLQNGDCCDEDVVRQGRDVRAVRHRSPQAWPVADEDRVPRWMVVVGVVVYCAAAWVVVFHLGGAATDWLIALVDRSTSHAAVGGR